MREQVLTVTEVTRAIRSAIESIAPSLRVRGEISNFTHHASGHLYFSLKDENATLRCVMFRGSAMRLRFSLRDGLQVEADGTLGIYERAGQYQLVVAEIVPAGRGALYEAFEVLKMRLAAEGLFDSGRKRSLPRYPARIGVITSPTGAAIRDIIQVARRRNPAVCLVVLPVRVQGEGASLEIAAALDTMNRYGRVDVVIVGRGGGSIEDLWAFNEEIVARAIVRSKIPVIAAVGHEVDFTIADFVADHRAPTPSAAVETAIPDRRLLLRDLVRTRETLEERLLRSLDEKRTRIARLLESHVFRRPQDLIEQKAQRVDDLARELTNVQRSLLRHGRLRIDGLATALSSLDPRSILSRGYCIVWNEATGTHVRSALDLRPSDRIRTEFSADQAVSVVERVERKPRMEPERETSR